MSGNPNEYRKNALRCSDLARTAKTPELTTLLIGLSKTWTKMAREFEGSQTKTMPLDERIRTHS